MHHATAQNLQPAALLADRTAATITHKTLHVQLSAWLGEGEMVSAEAGPDVRAKHPPRKIGERTFQIGHANAAPHGQAFNLPELNILAGRYLLIAITQARQNN